MHIYLYLHQQFLRTANTELSKYIDIELVNSLTDLSQPKDPAFPADALNIFIEIANCSKTTVEGM